MKTKNVNKYLTFASTDKNKEVLKKYTELWDEIKYLSKTINGGEQASQWIFCALAINLLCKEIFSQTTQAIYCPP